jgi:alpha-L-arabinofuranosidase
VVKIANLAQIVNVIAPIHTRGDELLLHTIYYPFVMYAARRDGVAIRPAVSGPVYDSPSYGRVNYLDTSAILGEGMLHTFLVNRSTSEIAEIEIDHASGQIESVLSAEVVSGPGPKASNTFDAPNIICAKPLNGVKVRDGRASLHLPPLSVAAVTLKVF